MGSNQKLVDDFRKAMFIDHDPAAIARLYTEDAILMDVGQEEPIRGNQAIADYHATFLRAFPDLSAETRNVFGSGDWFAAEFLITGTHTGPLDVAPGQSIPATGKRITLNACWIGRVTPDGRCAEDHTYYDTAVFANLAQEPATH
jgi:ketosteroid isomerase-like protein